MKYEDMSEILGTSIGALKASYHHAVKNRELLKRMPLNLFKRNVSNKERRTTMKEEDELLKNAGQKSIHGTRRLFRQLLKRVDE